MSITIGDHYLNMSAEELGVMMVEQEADQELLEATANLQIHHLKIAIKNVSIENKKLKKEIKEEKKEYQQRKNECEMLFEELQLYQNGGLMGEEWEAERAKFGKVIRRMEKENKELKEKIGNLEYEANDIY